MKPLLTTASARKKTGLELCEFRHSTGNTVVIQYFGRPFVVVKDGTDYLPYWMSTGKGGKTGVPIARWYPIIGMSPKWINKYNHQALLDYYGSERLRFFANVLDKKMKCLTKNGDINGKFSHEIPILEAEQMDNFLELVNMCSPKPQFRCDSGDVRVTMDMFLKCIHEKPYVQEES